MQKVIVIIYDSYVQSHLKLIPLFQGITLEKHFALACIWRCIRKQSSTAYEKVYQIINYDVSMEWSNTINVF